MKKRRKRLNSYLRDLQCRMSLAHWWIVFDKAYLDHDDAWARITALPDAQDAVITLSPVFFDLTPHEQRETLVHELTHLHFRSLTGTPGMIKQEVSLPLWSALGDRMKHEEERAVDALARVIAPLLPLPEDS